MIRLLAISALLTGCSSEPPAVETDNLTSVRQKCENVTEQPEGFGWKLLPIELYNECIVEEANRASGEQRIAICALGRSGGYETPPSTVEVYMDGNTCRTDYT